MGFFVHQGSSATLFGYDIYDDDCPRLIEWAYDQLRRIDDMIYWISYRTWDRYHIVRTDMRPGYSDVEEIMFRSCFALLRRFVEIELGTAGEPDCMYRGYRLHSEGDPDKEAIDLWCWYKDELPKLEKAAADCSADRDDGGITFVPNGDGTSHMVITDAARVRIKEYGRIEQEIEEAKQKNLEHLIRIRRHLWT